MAKKKTVKKEKKHEVLKIVAELPINRVTPHAVKMVLASAYGWTPEKEEEDGRKQEWYISRKISQVLSRDYVHASEDAAKESARQRTVADIGSTDA